MLFNSFRSTFSFLVTIISALIYWLNSIYCKCLNIFYASVLNESKFNNNYSLSLRKVVLNYLYSLVYTKSSLNKYLFLIPFIMNKSI